MERLGLGPDELLAAQPRAGLRADDRLGPDRAAVVDAPATTSATSPSPARSAPPAGPDERPAPPMNLLGDFGGGGVFLALGALAALISARTTGRGQVVDAAIVDGTAVLTTMIHGMLDGGSWMDRRGREPARHRGAVLRRLPLRRRAVRRRRRPGGAVLRGAARRPGSGRRRDAARPDGPAAVAGAARAFHRTRSPRAPAPSGGRCSRAPTPASRRCCRCWRRRRTRTTSGAGGVRRGGRHRAAQRRAAVLGHARPRRPGAGGGGARRRRSAPNSASDVLPHRSGSSLASTVRVDPERSGNLIIMAGQRRRVSGNSRSTNRSTTGCGSWLASPGRSLASMNT